VYEIGCVTIAGPMVPGIAPNASCKRAENDAMVDLGESMFVS
jgi:hypothetical protein